MESRLLRSWRVLLLMLLLLLWRVLLRLSGLQSTDLTPLVVGVLHHLFVGGPEVLVLRPQVVVLCRQFSQFCRGLFGHFPPAHRLGFGSQCLATAAHASWAGNFSQFNRVHVSVAAEGMIGPILEVVPDVSSRRLVSNIKDRQLHASTLGTLDAAVGRFRCVIVEPAWLACSAGPTETVAIDMSGRVIEPASRGTGPAPIELIAIPNSVASTLGSHPDRVRTAPYTSRNRGLKTTPRESTELGAIPCH